jgi:hypothetical protein
LHETVGSEHLIGGTNHTFSFTILCGSVRARHAKENAMGRKERAGVEVVELATIIALQPLDRDAKLGADMGEKI